MNAPVLLFGAFGILLIMGAPITLALALSATVTYLYVGQELTTLVQIAFSSVNSFPIMALPAFVLAGFRRHFGFGSGHYGGRGHAHDPGNDSPRL